MAVGFGFSAVPFGACAIISGGRCAGFVTDDFGFSALPGIALAVSSGCNGAGVITVGLAVDCCVSSIPVGLELIAPAPLLVAFANSVVLTVSESGVSFSS